MRAARAPTYLWCLTTLLVWAVSPQALSAQVVQRVPQSAHVPVAAPKTVLIVRSESPDLAADRILIDQIEANVRAGVSSPVEFYIESVDTNRFSGAAYEKKLAELFGEKYGPRPLDLVVALSEPAVQFVLRERSLFSGAPLLLGMIERRTIPVATVPRDAGVVFVQMGPVSTLRLGLHALPWARRVLVVGGASRADRGWMRLVREDLREFDPTIPIEYDTESTVEELLRRTRTLPPDALVLLVSMTRDPDGATVQPMDVLQALRASTGVPIFGLVSTLFGNGIVGGALLDFDRHGADLGRQAVRLMAGERPAPLTTPARTAVDWREMQRHGIAESALPPSYAIAFREPGVWARQKRTILLTSLVVTVETALIVAFLWNGYRRREVQRRLETRLRFERLLSEFSVSLAATPSSGIDGMLDAALARGAAPMRIDRIWRWAGSSGEDAGWRSALLCAGEPEWFEDAAALPPSIRRRLAESGVVPGSTLAVPLVAGDVMCGALFGMCTDPAATWAAEQGLELGVLAAVVATVLQRKEAEHAREGSDRLKGAILDSLPAHVAVVDRAGVIIAVNDAWSAFGGRHAPTAKGGVGEGVNYLDVCATASAAGDAGARDAAILIAQACRGERTARQVEFRTKGPDADRWFLMTAEPLRRAEGGAVVTHWEITRRKLNELALRESEDRFRRMADALPVSIWMSDAAGACIYLNKQWLQITGRSLAEESGDGWLESVYPDDRTTCMDAYLRAFHARESFNMEYRIRRYDGTYRWVMDSGTPRYGSDGVFHGFVGGCLDITEQKEAVQLLRDLSHRLMRAQDDERRRIARELHDHLSQQLALLAVDLQQLAIKPVPMRDALPALQEAWRRTTEIASDVHAISHRLHPSKMEALGLVATAQAHCRDVSRQSLPVLFQQADVPSGIPADRALSVFRVLEEALSNVVRHSGATEAKVTLVGSETHLVLRVADNGSGFIETGRPSGLGLVSMRERVQLLEGTLSINSVPAKGCVVEARVPIAPVRGQRAPLELGASVPYAAPGDVSVITTA